MSSKSILITGLVIVVIVIGSIVLVLVPFLTKTHSIRIVDSDISVIPLLASYSDGKLTIESNCWIPFDDYELSVQVDGSWYKLPQQAIERIEPDGRVSYHYSSWEECLLDTLKSRSNTRPSSWGRPQSILFRYLVNKDDTATALFKLEGDAYVCTSNTNFEPIVNLDSAGTEIKFIR